MSPATRGLVAAAIPAAGSERDDQHNGGDNGNRDADPQRTVLYKSIHAPRVPGETARDSLTPGDLRHGIVCQGDRSRDHPETPTT